MTPIDRLCIDTLRTLAMDAVQAAESGHPGAPMALAPVAYTLWQRFLRYDPADPVWPDRDRFVLSNGHASMLIYGLIHLAGVRAVKDETEVLAEPALTLDDIKRFRQLDSRTAGHPEYRLTSGVECTTGPLGTGIATSVGMALAGRWLAARYDRPGFPLFRHRVWAIAGDGCMMEGLSHEAASLAGHLKLGNLCWIYDSNGISIDGETSLTLSDDAVTRFLAYGWHVLHVHDANDVEGLARAYDEARASSDRPTLIVVDSHIAFGAPNLQDSAKAHGEPLGEAEIRATKKVYGWPEDARFRVPDGVRERFAEELGARGRKEREEWQEMFARYRQAFPAEAAEIDLMQRRGLPEGWDADLPVFPADPKGMATRASSGKVLNAIGKTVPWLVGGSADLTGSVKTKLEFDHAGTLSARNPGGRNIHFGVREFGMGCAVNGMSLSRLRSYGGTFLIFSDFARGSIRLASLMELPVIWVLTHDSIGLGEDGPTHQPVEQLASLRAVPNLLVLRPADANEVTECWRVAMQQTHSPSLLVLTRQNVPTLDRTRYAPAAGSAKGGYVLADSGGTPEVILIGTGSEVSLCVSAHEALVAEGVRSRVVSLPCWELFERQPQAYRDEVLPPSVTARVAVEQAATMGWERYVGPAGKVIGMTTFGASAPLADVQRKFGFTPERVLEVARGLRARG